MKIQPIHGYSGIAARREVKTGRNVGERTATFADQLERAVQLQNRLARNQMRPILAADLQESNLVKVLNESEALYLRKLYEADAASICYNGRCETEKLGMLGRNIDLSA